MGFGQNTLQRESAGPETEELQLRLAGFRGTVWDGDFGPGTELQVIAFQKEYMGMETPTGRVEQDTFDAIRRFADEFPIDFTKLKCECGKCGGFGKQQFKGRYQTGQPQIEMYHRYEYPGIHKAILNTFRAARFFAKKFGFPDAFFTCGYRCWINNRQRGRTSTNHMGKAIDCDFPMQPGEDKKDDCNRCDTVRDILVEKCGFQIGWSASNQKALEPSRIAPSWIHMDVRCYAPQYLDERFFVKSADELG